MAKSSKLTKGSLLSFEESKSIEEKVAFELHETECKLIKIGGIANVLGGLFIFAVLYNHVKLAFLVSWWAALFVINAINVVLAVYYQHNHPGPEKIHSRLKAFYIVIGLLCTVLGSMGVIFISTDLHHQFFIIAFLLIILVCFSFGTISNFILSTISINCLLVPSIVFQSYLAFSSFRATGYDPHLHLVFAISLVIVGSFLLAASYVGHRLIRHSFQLIFINALLNEKLKNANTFLEQRVKERTIELEKSLELVRYQATHDLLTQLPNERLLEEYIESEIDLAENNHHMFAIFFVGLNEMDKINDGLGHQASALTVQIIAKRLKNFFSRHEKGSLKNIKFSLSLSRRDEFVVLLKPLSELETIENVALSFFSVLEEPIQLENRAIKLTTSIGVSIYPKDGQNVKSLLMNADAAMRLAKKWGGNRMDIYKTEINADLSVQLERESYLHNALKNNEFRVFYQPFIDLKTGQICGMEALLRWKNPKLGFVSPADFIPLAEANGIILPLGEWVLRNACSQTKFWHLQGFSSLKVAVNLSAKQLQQKDILKIVAHILKEVNLSSEYIELELTESEAFKEETIPVIKQFKAMGLNLSIDDFGTGYSGLTNLKLFAIDKLKIDKSFVQDIDHSKDSRAIVINTIELAKKMGITVLAEGVETKEQLKFLRENGCDMIQGYYFSPAVTADEFFELLKNKQSLSLDDLE